MGKKGAVPLQGGGGGGGASRPGKKAMGDPEGVKLVAKNRSAFHDYFIEERVEAGISLVGSEVKSLRDGQVSLQEAYAKVRDGEVFLYDCHIAPYKQASWMNHEAKRTRKLLLHRRQIEKLEAQLDRRGYTLIPISVYFKRGIAKVEIGVGRGKQTFDKREDLRAAEDARAIRQAMGRRR